jgi:hypothetical protein
VYRRDGRGEPSSSPGERANAETGKHGASVQAEAQRPSTVARPKPRRAAGLPRAQHRQRSSSGTAAAVLDASEPNIQVGGAPIHGSLLTGLDGGSGLSGH